MEPNGQSSAHYRALQFIEARQYATALISIGKLVASEKIALVEVAYTQALQDGNIKAFGDIYFLLKGDKIPPTERKVRMMVELIIAKWSQGIVSEVKSEDVQRFYELLVHCEHFQILFDLRTELMKRTDFRNGYEVKDSMILSMKAYSLQRPETSDLAMILDSTFGV